MDESCSHCGNMTMAMLRSRYLLARRGGIPLALPRSSSSGRRTTSAQGQGDLRITVRASPSSTSPRASHSSSTSHRLGFPDEYAGSSDRAGPSISFGAPADDGISITASGDELGSGEDDSAALPPSGRVALPESDPELTAMLSRAAESIGLHYRHPPSPERSRLDDWFLGAQAERRQPPPVPFFPEVHEEVTRSWKAPFSARNRPSASSVLITLDGGAAQGYVEVPPVERAIAMQWSQEGEDGSVRDLVSTLPSPSLFASGQQGPVRGRDAFSRIPCPTMEPGQCHTTHSDPTSRRTAFRVGPLCSISLPHRGYVSDSPGPACTVPGGLARAPQAVSLAPEDYQTRLRDSVRPASPQVQGHSVHLSVEQGCPCLACRSRGPTGEGPSSRDEVRVLQPLLHRTQERRWVTTNPGPARSEPGPSQAPVQDVDAETHLSMRPSLRLVCSNRPEGRLLPCLDPPSTQTVSPLCVRGASIPVQGPSLRAIPVASCLHQGRRSSPCTVKGSRHSYPQLPRRLAHPGPVSSTVVRTQGYGAQLPQPVGTSGQPGKEQTLPYAEDLFSRHGVGLGQPHSTSLRGACSVNAEMPGVSPAQEGGSTETFSEAPGAYGILSRYHAARIASYETASALAPRPSPEMGMAPRHIPGLTHPVLPSHLQPMVGPCLSSGRSSPRASIQACCCFNRRLCHGLGGHVQRARSRGALDRAPAAVAYQLPRVAGSMACSAPLQNAATREAYTGPLRQHCDRCVHQPPGRSTLPSHVATCPPSPPLESEASEVASRRSCPRRAQSCSRRALTSARPSGRMATPPRGTPADLETPMPFRNQVVNLQALPREEADPAIALLCPVCALRIYVDRTQSFRTSDQLFVCFGGQQKGRAVSKQRLAHWIVEAIVLAYQARRLPCPLGVRAHSTRGVASSWALARGASIADICKAAGWATPNTFARFYNLRIEPVSSRVLVSDGQ